MREICRQVANLLDRRTKTVALPTSLDGLSLAGNVYGGRIKILSYSVNQQPADACKGYLSSQETSSSCITSLLHDCYDLNLESRRHVAETPTFVLYLSWSACTTL
jgi:hypothetical protein